MATYFISDIHLEDRHPQITDNFLRFMDAMAPQADALYVLGDLFEVWIGDDIRSPLHENIIASFANLHAKGIPVYFIHGNRDFLIGKKFAAQTGIILLPDPMLIELYGRPVLLMHGDLLCTDDEAYQRFRRRVHNPIIQRLFLLLPKFIRRNIATSLRKKSQQYGQQVAPLIQDVNQQAVERSLLHYQTDTLIHGHTHKPALHNFMLNGKPAKRIVLAAWHNGGEILRYDEQHQISIIDL